MKHERAVASAQFSPRSQRVVTTCLRMGRRGCGMPRSGRQAPPFVFARRFPDVSTTPRNKPTLNVSPSPPVEVGKPVVFEVVFWQPPPPGWNLQYRFDFGDGTRTDWTSERQATHTYLSSANGSYPVHVEIASTYRDRVMPTKAIDKNVDVISPSNPIPTATASAAETYTPSIPSPSPLPPSLAISPGQSQVGEPTEAKRNNADPTKKSPAEEIRARLGARIRSATNQ